MNFRDSPVKFGWPPAARKILDPLLGRSDTDTDTFGNIIPARAVPYPGPSSVVLLVFGGVVPGCVGSSKGTIFDDDGSEI